MMNLKTFNAFKLSGHQMKNVRGGQMVEMTCTLGDGSSTNFYVSSPGQIGPVIDSYNSGYAGKPQYQVVGCDNPFAS
jgi:hypothetical protein